MTRILFALVLLSLAAPSLAGEDADRAVAEFRSLLDRKIESRADMAERDRAVAAWLAANAETDLGEHSFFRSFAHYFAGEYERAADGLVEYLDAREGFPTDAFDTIAGRIFLNRGLTAAKAGEVEIARDMLRRTLELYPRPATAYRAVAAGLRQDGSADALALLGDMTREVLAREDMEDAEKLATLSGMWGTDRREPAERPKQLRAFTATTLDGAEVSLADYRGKVLLVDFWASWCPPCIHEMPNVVAVREKYRDRGFEILGISLDGGEDAAKKVRATEKELGMDWPQIVSGKRWDAPLAVENGIESIPATFLLDREGRVRYTNLRGPELERRVAELLAEGRGR